MQLYFYFLFTSFIPGGYWTLDLLHTWRSSWPSSYLEVNWTLDTLLVHTWRSTWPFSYLEVVILAFFIPGGQLDPWPSTRTTYLEVNWSSTWPSSYLEVILAFFIPGGQLDPWPSTRTYLEVNLAFFIPGGQLEVHLTFYIPGGQLDPWPSSSFSSLSPLSSWQGIFWHTRGWGEPPQGKQLGREQTGLANMYSVRSLRTQGNRVSSTVHNTQVAGVFTLADDIRMYCWSFVLILEIYCEKTQHTTLSEK